MQIDRCDRNMTTFYLLKRGGTYQIQIEIGRGYVEYDRVVFNSRAEAEAAMAALKKGR